MEESRLKPMVADYNPQLFEKLYAKTEGLRRKLASGIDHRRFGVDNDEILSWFTVKFIFAYNKYCKKYNEDILLGHMIRAMQFFKCRIIKSAYTVKYSQSMVEFTGQEHNNLLVHNPDPIDDNHERYYNLAVNYLRDSLSDNAYTLLQLQINPPPYILRRLTEKSIGNIHKIPDELIAEYFDLGFTDRTYKYISGLKKEIKQGISNARYHFTVS